MTNPCRPHCHLHALMSDLVTSGSSAETSCRVQARKHKSFKDGALRLCSNRSLLYDEVSGCRVPNHEYQESASE